MRDDFIEPTKDTLAHRVGFRCSNPNCQKATSGPQIDPTKSINIGVAAHIKAASPGGKRYDANQTSEQRKSVDNGIWLCQSCSKLIDSDETRYTVDLLHTWKSKAEAIALNELEEKKASGESNIIVRYSADDKDFALWLSLQLISQGYPVWCDHLNSEPGEYTQALVEDLIENKATKYLFILSSSSNNDTYLLKELRFAYEIMQSKKLLGFVVPVQVIDVPDDERTILLQGTSPIDFSQGWSIGLNNLIKYFEKSGVTQDDNFSPTKANDLWRLQFDADKGLKFESEELLSNWFPIHLPETLYFHELQRKGIGPLTTQKENLPFPAIQNNIYLITFAKTEDFFEKLGTNLSIKSTIKIKLQDFLDGNYDNKLAKTDLAWNFVIELLNDAWIRFFSQTKLKKYVMANNRISFYFPIGFSKNGNNKVFFQGVDGKRTWRFLTGKHKNNFWHFGIQGRAMLYPEPAYLIKSHGLASNDGLSVWESKEKLHTARRRWFRNWWNPEWRDRLLAALTYLSDEEDFFKIPLGTDVYVSVSSTPLVFLSPTTYVNIRDNFGEPDVEDDYSSDADDYDDDFEDTSEEDDL